MEIWVIVVKMVKVQVSIMDVLECCLASRMLSAGGVLTAHHEEVPHPSALFGISKCFIHSLFFDQIR